MSRKPEQAQTIVDNDILSQVHPDAAGIDIHLQEHWVCVPQGRDEQSVRKFGAFTADLVAIADWLQACGVKTVAMEATSVYWIPLYEVLSERGFEVYLVNAHTTKNVTGRKTDLLDCQWLQQLHSDGLLRASFRPAADIVTLRSYVRHRDTLLRYRAMHIQHMQKALELMNLKLSSVVTDITGMTGMKIIRTLLAGEQDPHTLAQLRDPRCHKTSDEIAKALTGHYRPEHLFLLQQSLELYDIYTEKLAACDAAIEAEYAVFAVQVADFPPPAPSTNPPGMRRRQGNQPAYDLQAYLTQIAGVDLTEVPGLDVLLVQEIITEIGLDMSHWPTDKHFTSWLGLAPNNKISAGKTKSQRTKPIQSRANLAFRLAARSVARMQSALGAFYRRLRAKHGAPKAITATARKIAVIVYQMLKLRQPYLDLGATAYEERFRERKFRALQRQAKQFGWHLLPEPLPVVS
jgi:transposase